MEKAINQKKRWFLKIEFAVLICVICIWIIKAFTVDLNSTKAAVLRQVVKINPNNTEAQNLLGNAYFDLADYEKAVEAYETAIRINPDNADTYRYLAGCYYSLERAEDEIEAHKQVARIEPSDTRAYRFLAGCCIEQERYEEAADAIKKIVDDACVLFALLGHSCCNSGQYEKAVEAYKQAIQINPNNGVTHYLLAETYVKMGDKDLALEQYEILKTIDEELSNGLLSLIEK